MSHQAAFNKNLRVQLHQEALDLDPKAASPKHGTQGTPRFVQHESTEKKGWGNVFPQIRKKRKDMLREEPQFSYKDVNSSQMMAAGEFEGQEPEVGYYDHVNEPPRRVVVKHGDMTTYPNGVPRSTELTALFDRMDLESSSSGGDFVRQALRIEASERSREDLNIIARFLKSFAFFKDVVAGKATEMARNVGYQELRPNTVLYQEGDTSTAVFIILAGSVRVLVGGHRFRDLAHGDAVGHQTLGYGDGAKTDTVETITPTALLVCEGDVFSKVTRMLMTEQRQHSTDWLHANVFFCEGWRRHKVLELANNCTKERFEQGEIVCHQGQAATLTFFVQEGEVTVLKQVERNCQTRWPGGHAEVMHKELLKVGLLTCGDFYGENRAIIPGSYVGSLRVASKGGVTLLAVPNKVLQRLIARDRPQLAAIRRHNAHLYLNEESLMKMFEEKLQNRKKTNALKNNALPDKYLARRKQDKKMARTQLPKLREPRPNALEGAGVGRGSVAMRFALTEVPGTTDLDFNSPMLLHRAGYDVTKAARKCAKEHSHNDKMKELAKAVDKNVNPYIMKFTNIHHNLRKKRVDQSKAVERRKRDRLLHGPAARARRPACLTSLERQHDPHVPVYHSVGTGFFF